MKGGGGGKTRVTPKKKAKNFDQSKIKKNLHLNRPLVNVKGIFSILNSN